MFLHMYLMRNQSMIRFKTVEGYCLGIEVFTIYSCNDVPGKLPNVLTRFLINNESTRVIIEAKTITNRSKNIMASKDKAQKEERKKSKMTIKEKRKAKDEKKKVGSVA